MLSITDEYNKAVAQGDTQYANYLKVIMGGVASDPQAAASVGLGVSNTPPSTPTAPGDAVSNFFGGILDNVFGSGTYSPSSTVAGKGDIFGFGTASQIGSQISGVASAVGSGVSFITDIPRVATTLVGGLMIAAGLFALAGGSHNEIIQLMKKSP